MYRIFIFNYLYSLKKSFVLHLTKRKFSPGLKVEAETTLSGKYSATLQNYCFTVAWNNGSFYDLTFCSLKPFNLPAFFNFTFMYKTIIKMNCYGFKKNYSV